MIWPFRKASVEQKSGTSAPDAWLLELFGAVSSSGLTVTTTEALTVPAVGSAIRVISEAAASLNIKVDARTDDGWTEAPDHPVATLLSGDVNDWLSGFEFVRDLVAQALIHDTGGLAWVNRANGKPVEIIHYDAGSIGVQRSPDGTGEYAYTLSGRPLPARDVIHLRGPFTRSPLSLAKEAIAISKAMALHAGGLFTRGARPSGAIEFPHGVDEAAFKKMQTAWASAYEGTSNSGRTAFLWNGAKFNPLTLNSTDAQFLELRKFQILEIARAFRVPPSMLFELDRVTWSNAEQMGKEFLTYCLEPWLRALEGALRRGLFTADECRAYRIRFERDDLTRADLGSRATAYSSLIASRVINPNEARAWEDMPPYDGGEVFANPNTGASQPGAAAPQPDDDEPNLRAAA